MVHRNSICKGARLGGPAHAVPARNEAEVNEERTRPRVLPTGAPAGWRCASNPTERCLCFSDASVWLARRQPLHTRARALPIRPHATRSALGLGLVEYISPDFSPASPENQNSPFSRIFQPFSQGKGIKCLILYTLMPLVSEYVGIFLIKFPPKGPLPMETETTILLPPREERTGRVGKRGGLT